MNADEAAKTLERDGVTIVEDVLDDDQCRRLQEGFEWGLANTVGPRPLQRQRTYEWFREHPILVELLGHPLPIAVADACLGPEYHCICAETTRNEKDNHFLEAVKDIHQDHCFFPEQADLLEDMQTRMYGFTAQWVYHDIPSEMGPTEFIVGSHVGDIRYSNEEAPDSISFIDHFPKGCLVLYDHRTWHRGTDNHSEAPRDLTQNCYALHAVDKVQIMTPQADGTERYVPCEELLADASDIVHKLLDPV